jgi:signal transduction histidine kinase
VFVIFLLTTLVVSMAVFALLLSPGPADLALMAALFTLGTLAAMGLGFGIYRAGWDSYFPRLLWSLLAGYVLAGVLTFVGIWATARLMFLSRHDMLLSAALLVFATGTAVALGYLMAKATEARVERLARAAGEVAGGNLHVRVPVTGRDELSGLAEVFNLMTEQLADADSRRAEVEQLRRDLISWVGHDLRTPLASVRVIIDAMADGIIDDKETIDRYLTTARRDLAALTGLIDDLFLLTQLDSGRFPLDRQYNSLGDLVSDTLQSLTVLAETRDVKLMGEAAPGLDPVFFDAQHLERALRNLVQNAVDYASPGGCIRVRAWSSDSLAHVEVADSGPGIAAEHLEHIFERFYRGEKSRSRDSGGAGLGLAIAQGIVQAHGGEIRVRNLPQAGASFSFSIPRG